MGNGIGIGPSFGKELGKDAAKELGNAAEKFSKGLVDAAEKFSKELGNVVKTVCVSAILALLVAYLANLYMSRS